MTGMELSSLRVGLGIYAMALGSNQCSYRFRERRSVSVGGIVVRKGLLTSSGLDPSSYPAHQYQISKGMGVFRLRRPTRDLIDSSLSHFKENERLEVDCLLAESTAFRLQPMLRTKDA